jgi:hypothetical protein
MENIIVAWKYKDARKVRFAFFRLLGPARDWWLRKNEEHEATQIEWTWTEFLATFRKQFIPRCIFERLATDFYTLQQGSRTMESYAVEFT